MSARFVPGSLEEPYLNPIRPIRKIRKIRKIRGSFPSRSHEDGSNLFTIVPLCAKRFENHESCESGESDRD